jgi:membrane protein YqaA with SNARE-associated domain
VKEEKAVDGIWLVFATLAVAMGGGLVPVINVEAWVLGISVASPAATLVPVVLAASLGQVVAKCLLYRAGGGAVAWSTRGDAARVAAAVRRLEGAASRGTLLVFASALTGVPPLCATSLAAGAARFRFDRFLLLTLVGRVLRFGFVFLLPRVVVAT